MVAHSSCSKNEPGEVEGVAGDAEDVAVGVAHLLLPAVRKLSLVRLGGVAGDSEDVAALLWWLIFFCQLFNTRARSG